MGESSWALQIDEQCALIAPSGTPVKKLPHKALGLLAALALNMPEPLSRSAAGTILWPQTTPEKRQTSLRQALLAIKNATEGAPFLTVRRTNLALNTGCIEIKRIETPDFLCQFSEPWFSLFRSSESAARMSALESTEAQREASAVRSLEDVLDWSIQYQPNQAFGLIRHTVDLCNSIPPYRALTLSKKLLRRGSMSHPLRGWGNLLHAFSLFYCLETEAARAEFDELRLAAMSRGDSELTVLSAFFEAGCLLPMGLLDRADSVLAQCQSATFAQLSSRATIRLAHGEGLAACCRSDYTRGFRMLRHALENALQSGEQYEAIYCAANLSWVSASVGNSAIARFALQAFDQTNSGEHWRFQMTANLARIHLACSDGNPKSGLQLGQQLLAYCQQLQAIGFELYVRETLARCYMMLGDKQQARQELLISARIRKKIQWNVIPWDADRLEFGKKA